MTGPVFSERDALNLDRMIASAGGEGFDGLDALLSGARPEGTPSPAMPNDDVAMFLAALAYQPQGRAAQTHQGAA